MHIRRELYHQTGRKVAVDLFVKNTSDVLVVFRAESVLVTGKDSGIYLLY